jgi:hypothetical protein
MQLRKFWIQRGLVRSKSHLRLDYYKIVAEIAWEIYRVCWTGRNSYFYFLPCKVDVKTQTLTELVHFSKLNLAFHSTFFSGKLKWKEKYFIWWVLHHDSLYVLLWMSILFLLLFSVTYVHLRQKWPLCVTAVQPLKNERNGLFLSRH